MITIKPERHLEPCFERGKVGGWGLTLMVKHVSLALFGSIASHDATQIFIRVTLAACIRLLALHLLDVAEGQHMLLATIEPRAPPHHVKTSLENCVSSASGQVSLGGPGRYSADGCKDLLVVVPQPRLGVRVGGWQPGDVAVVPLAAGVEARCRLDIRVRSCRPVTHVHDGCSAVLLEHKRTETLGGLGNVRRPIEAAHRSYRTSCSGFSVWQNGSRHAAVVLRRHDRRIFARGFGDDLAKVLVAALRRLPVLFAERLADGVDVELIEESLVRLLVGRCGNGCHGGLRVRSLVDAGVKRLSFWILMYLEGGSALSGCSVLYSGITLVLLVVGA